MVQLQDFGGNRALIERRSQGPAQRHGWRPARLEAGRPFRPAARPRRREHGSRRSGRRSLPPYARLAGGAVGGRLQRVCRLDDFASLAGERVVDRVLGCRLDGTQGIRHWAALRRGGSVVSACCAPVSPGVVSPSSPPQPAPTVTARTAATVRAPLTGGSWEEVQGAPSCPVSMRLPERPALDVRLVHLAQDLLDAVLKRPVGVIVLECSEVGDPPPVVAHACVIGHRPVPARGRLSARGVYRLKHGDVRLPPPPRLYTDAGRGLRWNASKARTTS